MACLNQNMVLGHFGQKKHPDLVPNWANRERVIVITGKEISKNESIGKKN